MSIPVTPSRDHPEMQKPAPLILITNHIDACGVTGMIAATCLLLHGQARPVHFGFILTLMLTCWLAFAVNDYFDAPQDARDAFKQNRNFFVHYQLPRRWLLVGFLLTVGLIAVGFTRSGANGLVEFTVAMAAIPLYSMPPLRLKSRPLLDLVMHAVFVETAPYYATLYILQVEWTALDRLLLALFFVGSLTAQLEQQSRDFDTDLEPTFAKWIGRRPAALFLRLLSGAFLVIGSVGLLTNVIPLWFIPFALFGLPILLHRFFRKAEQARSQRLVIVTLILMTVYAVGVFGMAVVRGGGL
jgi:4-hydroxybenzoate polyprenyltransferase